MCKLDALSSRYSSGEHVLGDIPAGSVLRRAPFGATAQYPTQRGEMREHGHELGSARRVLRRGENCGLSPPRKLLS